MPVRPVPLKTNYFSESTQDFGDEIFEETEIFHYSFILLTLEGIA